MTAADCISALRLALVLLIWPFALFGQGRLVGIGLILAGLTDVADGYLARRLHQTSRRGARWDAIADTSLMVSAAAWLEVLHPEIVRDNAALLAVAVIAYAASTSTSLIVHGRLVDPRQLSSKVAGGLLYAFALITLLTGAYEPLLLTLALLALTIACAEAVVVAVVRKRAERMTTPARAAASRQRSQTPHASNDVASSASPITSSPTSVAATSRSTRP